VGKGRLDVPDRPDLVGTWHRVLHAGEGAEANRRGDGPGMAGRLQAAPVRVSHRGRTGHAPRGHHGVPASRSVPYHGPDRGLLAWTQAVAEADESSRTTDRPRRYQGPGDSPARPRRAPGGLG